MNILYIMSTYNLYGGTPKKTLDLMNHFKENSSLYIYEDGYRDLKSEFEKSNAHIYEGFYGKNIFLHIKKLIKIIDTHNIDIVQTQFTMGEMLGYLIKLFRPKIKLVIAFVGPFEPKGYKKNLTNFFYKKADSFVFISNYVRSEKINQFPILKKANTNIIYNGTHRRKNTNDKIIELKKISLLSVSGLVDWKNIDVLVEAMNLLVNEDFFKDIYLYIAGDGPERSNLENKIKKYSLENNIYLIGYQKNIGKLLDTCDIYVHSAYAEGFGIAVAEAMMAGKPLIVSNKGALPELIVNNESGFIVEYNNPKDWANSIKALYNDENLRLRFGIEAKKRAYELFSVNKYIENYNKLYLGLLDKK